MGWVGPGCWCRFGWATGERAGPRSPQAPEVLTPQEDQIARLVAGHLTSRAQLARTIRSDNWTPAPRG